jgi:hypothetical protein
MSLHRVAFRLFLVALTGCLMASGGCSSKEEDARRAQQRAAEAASAATAAVPPAPAPSSSAPTLPALAPEPPPAPLGLTADLDGAEFYGGEELPITVRLVSPRARREAYRRLQDEQAATAPGGAGGKTPGAAPASAPAAVDWPKIPAQWAQAISLSLLRIDANDPSRRSAVNLDWSKLMAPAQDGNGAIEIGSPSRQWIVPAEANLAPGRYVLQVSWNGRGTADASWLAPDGTLRCEMEFDVVEAVTNSQKAAHLARQAWALYQKHDFAKARDLARESYRIDSGEYNQREATLEMVADCSTGLGDLKSAISEYEDLLRMLPKGGSRAATMQKRIDILKEVQAKESGNAEGN